MDPRSSRLSSIATSNSSWEPFSSLPTSPHSELDQPLSNYVQQNPHVANSLPAMLNIPIPRSSPALNTPAPHSSVPTFHGNDWNNVFSSPLDPDMFAALAASGMLPPQSSSHQPTNVPGEPSRASYPQHGLTHAPHLVDNTYPRSRMPPTISPGPVSVRGGKVRATIVSVPDSN